MSEFEDTGRVWRLEDLRRWRRDAPSLAVVGHPIAHSQSPRMHNAALDALRQSAPAGTPPPLAGWRYFKFDIAPEELPEALALFHANGFRGLNLTIPHKVAALTAPGVTRITPRGAAAGALNTLARRDNGFAGDNTDGAGFVRALREDLGADAAGARFVIFGAGGAARGIAAAALAAGADAVWIGNRSRERLDALLVALNGALPAAAARARPFDPSREAEAVAEAAAGAFAGAVVAVNATPLGLRENDPSPVPAAARFWRRTFRACDIVVPPRGGDTAFLREARAAGAAGAADGRGMLCWQGVLAFEQWTGIEPPAAVMRAALAPPAPAERRPSAAV